MSPVAALLAIAALACTPTFAPAKQLTAKPGYVTTHADTRVSYFAGSLNPLRYCAEPMPDALREEQLKLLADRQHKASVSVKATEGATVNVTSEEALKAELTRSVIMKELAGRDATVLLARELMYRLCEINLNFNEADPRYYASMAAYKQMVEALVLMTKADKAAAETTRALVGDPTAAMRLQADREVSSVERLIGDILALVYDKDNPANRGCTTEPVPAAKRTLLAKSADLADVASALKGADTCADLKSWLEMFPSAVLEKIRAALTVKPADKPADKQPEADKPKDGEPAPKGDKPPVETRPVAAPANKNRP